MTSKRRKYGDLSANPLPTESADLIDDVFAAFTGAKRAPVESTPLVSAPVEITPVETAPPVISTSEPLENTPAVVSAPAVETTPVTSKKGYFKLPNAIMDEVVPTMRPAEQSVFLHLYRLSHGFNKPTCLISLPQLAVRCRLSESQTRFAVRNVAARGFIRQERIEQGAKTRGIEFWVWSPSDSTPVKSTPVETTPVKSTPNKKELKDISKKSVACATCKDTGWFYPEGVAKGVRRCDHGEGKP